MLVLWHLRQACSTRQVGLHCYDRGLAMAEVWNLYSEVYDSQLRALREREAALVERLDVLEGRAAEVDANHQGFKDARSEMAQLRSENEVGTGVQEPLTHPHASHKPPHHHNPTPPPPSEGATRLRSSLVLGKKPLRERCLSQTKCLPGAKGAHCQSVVLLLLFASG